MSFDSVLVANRGEIARRIFRTARAMGMRCIAVYADADADALHVRDADEAVRLPGGYLDAVGIVDAAVSAGARAIHPGYGFLAENAAFAKAVNAAGVTWIGPRAEVIAAMGDKLAAKRAAHDAGVPTLPSGRPTDAPEIGFPLLVKAAAGGGGKGMRAVHEAGDLDAAVAAAGREAEAAFGDGTVFLERLVRRARHIEIQVLGDQHGNVVHLGERECSIQRRHQKVVEESPSPALDEHVRDSIADAAVRLAAAIGYSSAGTVEFLLDDETGEFYLLEVNTRLQVEHPVTEAVTGIDLVRQQLLVAMGHELDVADIAHVTVEGHAIEARLYAEDPAAGFLPASGTLAAFEPPAEPAVRWDSGVETGSVVGVDFDPMLAKVIAHAPTRSEAARRLALALERLHLGGVTTNRDLLVEILRDPAFHTGDTTTDYLERAGLDRVEPTSPHDRERLERAARVAALWLQGRNRAAARVLAGLPSGWRNARTPPERVSFVSGETLDTETRLDVSYRAKRDGTFEIDEGAALARVHRWSPRSLDVEIDGLRSVSAVTAAGPHLYVQVPTGTIALEVQPRFRRAEADDAGAAIEGGVVAPMPGVVHALQCAVGEAVTAGQTLVILEAMKMEHAVAAPADGVVAELRVTAGEHVTGGIVLAIIEPAAESSEPAS